VANSYLNGMMEHRFPVVIGKDFAGTVDAVGDGVSDYQVGDRVFGVVTKPYLGDGSFGEYVTVATAVGLAKLSADIDFTESGALGLAGCAAIASIDAADLEPGEIVLITGATDTVDYTGDFAVDVQALHPTGADVVLHFAGDAVAALAALRKGGRFVSTLIMSPEQLPTPDAAVLGIYASTDPGV
jgi:NADPH:quinone reductase